MTVKDGAILIVIVVTIVFLLKILFVIAELYLDNCTVGKKQYRIVSFNRFEAGMLDRPEYAVQIKKSYRWKTLSTYRTIRQAKEDLVLRRKIYEL